jgi:hypothetical protein
MEEERIITGLLGQGVSWWIIRLPQGKKMIAHKNKQFFA